MFGSIVKRLFPQKQTKLILPPISHACPYSSLDWGNNVDAHVIDSQFTAVTFNLLAPCYKRLDDRPRSLLTGRRVRESDEVLIWTERADATLEFFDLELLPHASILALQEFWLDERYAAMFREAFDTNGYEIRTLQRTGLKTDAVALAIKRSEFTVMGCTDVTLCTLGDRVALLLWLRHIRTGRNVLVANTHLSFPHSYFDRVFQMRQMKTLTMCIDR
jgi:hypothetical protein